MSPSLLFMGLGSFARCKAVMKLTIHSHLVPRSRVLVLHFCAQDISSERVFMHSSKFIIIQSAVLLPTIRISYLAVKPYFKTFFRGPAAKLPSCPFLCKPVCPSTYCQCLCSHSLPVSLSQSI